MVKHAFRSARRIGKEIGGSPARSIMWGKSLDAWEGERLHIILAPPADLAATGAHFRGVSPERLARWRS